MKGLQGSWHTRALTPKAGAAFARLLSSSRNASKLQAAKGAGVCQKAQAQVRPHSLVYDPFVGTGSIAIAAAIAGAWTMGSDIDLRVVRDGKVTKQGDRVDVLTNFADYRLRPPVGLLRQDAHTPAFRWSAGRNPPHC